MSIAPVARNAPCPCGSGRRYKDCHGVLDTAAVAPPSADVLVAEAQAALAAGRPADAHRALQRAGELAPERAELLRERARIELNLGDRAAAAATCRAAIERTPDDALAWNLLGEILRQGDAPGAEAAWNRALELDPNSGEAWFHVGNVLRERGEHRSAIANYERALEIGPGHPGVLNNLGLALEAVGEQARAEACYREVLAVQPRHQDALANLANVLVQREAFGEAAAAYDRVFAIRRDFPASIWVQRGIAQHETGALKAAEASFREAVRLAPETARAHANIGSICVELQRYRDAVVALSRTLELSPNDPHATALLAHARQHCCDWSGLDKVFADLGQRLDEDPREGDWRIPPFAALAMPMSPLQLLHVGQRWARHEMPDPLPPRPPVKTVPGERLRVGFVSTDFRVHPMAFLSMEYWERLDRDRLEVFAYGLGPEDRGPVGQRIKRAFEHFAAVSADPIAAIAQRIRDDRIAILFDLNGYTMNSRARIFGLRPAPIQINCIGFPGTLGTECYDYIYVDPFGAPPAMQPYFTEKFFYMPHASFPSDTTRAPKGPPPSRADIGLPERGFVFCCFNSSYKILPDVLAIWMRLLHATPGSVLWLLDTNSESKANLRREAVRAGVAADRLVFAPRTEVEKHVARNAAADLFVDCFPYGAHTTTNDALLAGLPVVTCAGDTLVSRIAGSQLRAIGLPELVTTNFRDYEALALRLAHQPIELAALRDRLVANRDTYPLFDMARYSRDLEDGLFRIWRDYAERTAS